MTRPVLRLVVSLLAVTLLLGATPTGAAGRHRVVLGARGWMTNAHGGWGTPHPDYLDFSGDPALIISHIRWHNWGSAHAFGVGRAYALRYINGNYYKRLVRAELRASKIGHCTKHGPRAYRDLKTRVQSKPGGRMGRWFDWSGPHGICRYP